MCEKECKRKDKNSTKPTVTYIHTHSRIRLEGMGDDGSHHVCHQRVQKRLILYTIVKLKRCIKYLSLLYYCLLILFENKNFFRLKKIWADDFPFKDEYSRESSFFFTLYHRIKRRVTRETVRILQ